MNFRPLSKREESIAEKIVDTVYPAQKGLESGFLINFYAPIIKKGIKRIIL